MRNEFYRVSVRTDHADETDEIRGWSHEIHGPVVHPIGVICTCLTKDIADRFCEWLNGDERMKDVERQVFGTTETTTLGDIIRQRRRCERLTLEGLASKVGTSKGYIHDLESGRASNPSFEFTMRLFGVLNLNANEVWRLMD